MTKNFFATLVTLVTLYVSTCDSTLSANSHRVKLGVKPGLAISHAHEIALQLISEAASNTEFWSPCLRSVSREIFQVKGLGWSTCLHQKASDLELEFLGTNADEAGWLCSRLLRGDCLGSPRARQVLDLTELAKRVVQHHNSQPPDPGINAESFAEH